ncbi:hypothetical protein M5D96_006075, partial [Drosophila gunungcola]
MKTNCEIQNGNESVDAIKYADIFNLAATCKIFRRIVWDWSKSMYRRLELDLLHVAAPQKPDDRRIENLGLFRNISKLSLKAHFEMIDLEEFCSNNPSLVTLEVNVNRFSDHGKLAQIVRHCPNLKQLKFLLNDNVTDNNEVEDWHRAQDLEMDEDFTIKRPRMDTEYESLLTGVSDLQRSIPVLQLLKAFSEKKKSKLIQLCLKFDIDDEMVQNCRKLSSFQIKVPTNGITKKFLKSLQATVIANRDPDMQEDLQFILNLKCATHKTKE